MHNNDSIAGTALTDAGTAYTTAQGEASVLHTLAPGDTLTPGAYALGTLANLSGSLTLNGAGDPNSVFVFTLPDSLTTASGSNVILTNGAQACNVFWQVGSSATLGTNSNFAGHIVALSSITATTGATINGSLVARTGTVTLDSNTITNNVCAPTVVVAPPAPVQSAVVNSVTPANCVASGPTTVTLNGTFPTPISNITVNGAVLAPASWLQTPTSIVVTAAVATTAPVVIQLYDGAVPTVTTGTIHVIKIVNNTYGGTAVPSDFMLTLRHWGTDVVGSPASGVADPGRTYVLAPGTYVLGEADTLNYIHSFNIRGQDTNFVDLLPGEDLTIIQTNNELPPLVAPVGGTVVPPPATVSGGVLPKTGSPWFNLLFLGVGAMVISGVVLGLKRSPKI